MKDVEKIRKGHIIVDVKTGTVTKYNSISSAKQWSLHFQKAGGVLGDGRLRVERGSK